MGRGNYSNTKSLQNMHPLQINAQCMFIDEVSLRIGGLGLCTRTGVPLTSLAQLNYLLLGQLIDELLVTLHLAGCIFGVLSGTLAFRSSLVFFMDPKKRASPSSQNALATCTACLSYHIHGSGWGPRPEKAKEREPPGNPWKCDLQKLYCLQQGSSKRGEGRPLLSCRGCKIA